MKILSLFSSAGIAETYIHYPGDEWYAVEIELELARIYKDRFPGSYVTVGDAWNCLDSIENYDLVIATPPCQSYTNAAGARRREPPDTRIIALLNALRRHGTYILENVNSTWLQENLPGWQQSGRHLIWTNVVLTYLPEPPYPENFCFIKGVPARQRPGLSITESYIRDLQAWYGVSLNRRVYIRGNHDPGQVYREAMHPTLMKYIFDMVIK